MNLYSEDICCAHILLNGKAQQIPHKAGSSSVDDPALFACLGRIMMRIVILVMLSLLPVLHVSGCVAGNLRESTLQEEGKYSHARGGYINSVSFWSKNGDLHLFARAAWLTDNPQEIDEKNTYLLGKGRAGSHSYRIFTGDSAHDIIHWYRRNEKTVLEALEVADTLVPKLIDWFELPDQNAIDMAMLLGANESPFVYEVSSNSYSGSFRIAVTDSPFYNYAHDLVPGLFSKAIHEIAHLKYVLKENPDTSPRSSSQVIEKRINEESAATILEYCTQYRFYQRFFASGISVPNIVLNQNYAWLPELFPGFEDKKFSPNSKKLKEIEPLNRAWERIAYTVLILLSKNGILDVRSDPGEKDFLLYCQDIATSVPDYLAGEVWPVQ